MLFSEIPTIVKGEFLQEAEDCTVSRFTIDSRKALGIPSEVFIAIEGLHNDGHAFIKDVYEKGIRHFILEKPLELPRDASAIVVADSITAFQDLAAHHREQFNYPVVGITGSNGKTIVKEWLATLLAERLKVVKSPKSYNSEVGVPLSVVAMGAHDVGVFEAGISGRDQMAALAKIIRPTLGIFTNIGEAHAEGFRDRAEKIKEKTILFQGCNKLICCQEHTEVFEALRRSFKGQLITWSRKAQHADYYFKKQGSRWYCDKEELTLDLPFDNSQSVENALHAVVAALELGVDNKAIERAVHALRPVPMRLELKKAINGCYIIDDSYNNDLVGLEVALDFMNAQNPHQAKTLVITDILQSGIPDKELYHKVRELVRSKEIYRTITIGRACGQYLEGEHFEDVNHFLQSLPQFQDETILLKGARPFGLERAAERLEETSHGTILEINFEALRHNLNQYRERLSDSTRLMVMVKAFAYGSGLGEIASFLQQERVDYLGVAYVDEAIQLRQKGIDLPIMIMNPQDSQLGLCETYNLEAEMYSLPVLRKFLASDVQVGVHLKLETGMNRLGFTQEDLPALLQLIKENPQLTVRGIFTHFSSSDDAREDNFTHQQAQRFQTLTDAILPLLPNRPLLHAVNSPGMLRFPEYHFDMTRLGIGLYGYDPTQTLTLQTVAQLKTHVSQIKSLRAGESVGYGRHGRVSKDTSIAILPIGYADGYLRIFGNGNARVKAKGHWMPTIGNICMDMTMVDATGTGLQEGDEVIVFGHEPSIADLADWAQTIPYEILTNISNRVKRTYVSE